MPRKLNTAFKLFVMCSVLATSFFANAEIVTYKFISTANGGHTVAGSGVQIGEPISGLFSYDTSVLQANPGTGHFSAINSFSFFGGGVSGNYAGTSDIFVQHVGGVYDALVFSSGETPGPNLVSGHIGGAPLNFFRLTLVAPIATFAPCSNCIPNDLGLLANIPFYSEVPAPGSGMVTSWFEAYTPTNVALGGPVTSLTVVNSVPEPQTYWMLLIGLAFIGWTTRSRHQLRHIDLPLRVTPASRDE